MKKFWFFTASVLSLCACAMAQSGGQDTGPVTLPAPPPGMAPPPGDVFFYRTQKLGGNGAFSMGYIGFAEFGNPVTGAPYTATAVTETTQVLADGNRIVNKTTTLLARDSQGRTRREETMGNIGPLAVKAPRMVVISDPVSKMDYVLDINDHTARVLPPVKVATVNKQMVMSAVPGPVATARVGVGADSGVGADAGPPNNFQRKEIFPAGPEAGVEQQIVISTTDAGQVRTESLGTQVIEGVTAEGKRITRTIPAGEIGNERALQITSEVWTSPDLQTVVLSKRSDPRFGETVYRLTDINRAEPDHSLFEVPANFTIRNAGN